MRYTCLLFLLCITVHSSYAQGSPGNNEKEERIYLKWVNANALPVTSFSIKDNELEKISKTTGAAILIGIGECTHGTSESFQMRFEVFKYLVEKKGFNAFILEDMMYVTESLNAYINGSNDSITTILKKSLMPVWNNREMAELFRWMRAYNQRTKNTLRFFGIDMQNPVPPMNRLVKMGADFDSALANIMQKVKQYYYRYFRSTDTAKGRVAKDSFLYYIKWLDRHYTDNTPQYLSRRSKDTIMWGKQMITLIRQCIPTMFEEWQPHYRDSCMAANIRWIMNTHPGTKAVLAAHNGHINNTDIKMGGYLKNYFRDKYYAIAFLSETGTYFASKDFNQSQWGTGNLEPAYPGTYEYLLGKSQYPRFYLSLKKDVSAVHKKEYLQRSVGFVQLEKQFAAIGPLNSLFDAVFFDKTTTHSRSYLLKE